MAQGFFSIHSGMKFQLTEKDHLEKHHIWGLVQNYYRENHHQPEYIIVHPATYHKILMLTNERNDEFSYPVIQFNYNSERLTMYGINFIRSEDVEEGFLILT